MRIDKVKYTAHFDEFGFIKDQWVGFEAEIDDTEDAEKQATVLKEITEIWYKKHNPNHQLNPPPIYDGNSFPGPRIIETKPEDREIGVTPEAILSSPDLKVLETYRWLIKSDKELERAYMVRYEQLTTLTTK